MIAADLLSIARTLAKGLQEDNFPLIDEARTRLKALLFPVSDSDKLSGHWWFIDSYLVKPIVSHPKTGIFDALELLMLAHGKSFSTYDLRPVTTPAEREAVVSLLGGIPSHWSEAAYGLMTYLEKGDKGTSIEGQEALVAIAKGALGQVRPGCRLAKWQRKARTIVHLSEFDVPDDPPHCTEWLWRKECEEVTRFVGSSRAEDAIAALGRQRSQLIADRCCGLLDVATFGKSPSKVVENLIERGASVNIRKMGRTPLKVVAEQGRAELLPYLVRKLRSEVADSGPLESEALIEGIRHPAVVEALLKAGTRLGPDPIGRLPLHEALHQPWRKILGEKKGAPHPAYQQLVAASDPLARDGDGNTIFHRWSPSENDFFPDSFLSRLIRDQRERFLEALVAENCEGELAKLPDSLFKWPPVGQDPWTKSFTLCTSPGCRLTWLLIDAGIPPDELSRLRRLFRREPEGGDTRFESVPPEYLKPQLAEIFAGTVSVNYQ